MWNPDGKAWRKMPKELLKPFLTQASKTRKQMFAMALGATVLIRYAVPPAMSMLRA